VDVLSAILYRQCVRAFLNKPVPKAYIETILNVAKWAPSGVNTQPWRVIVLTGGVKEALSTAILATFDQKTPAKPDYAYYPLTWEEPYKQRRKACGLALYSAIGIQLGEEEKRRAAWRRNYAFFGAPVGLLFLIDAHLEKGSWLDMGLFIQNVCLAARGLGLETCPQASMAEYPDLIRANLGIDSAWHVVCGMALGFADWDHPINQYRTTRLPISEFAEFRGDFS